MSDPASHSARTVAALTDVALEGLPKMSNGLDLPK